MIISAIGIGQAVDYLRSKKNTSFLQPYFIYPSIILISAWSLFASRPFYFSYASDLLPKKYILNLKDMGDGSYEAAQYLNSLPDAEKLTIWSDKGAVCETFAGRCIVSFKKNDVRDKNFDFLVISTGRKSRSMKMGGPMNSMFDFKKLYSPDFGVYKLEINDRPDNFVKVVRAQDIALPR